MKKIILEEVYDMTDYAKKIKEMTEAELLKEKEKLDEKLSVNYVCLHDTIYGRYAETERYNIKDNPDEKNRIYNRRKVAFVSKIISSKINQFASNMQDYWSYINKTFMESLDDFDGETLPFYATDRIKGKTVTFANRLGRDGMIAYKHFLMFLDDNMDKYSDFAVAVHISVEKEKSIHKNLPTPRNEFFTRKILPESLETISKNIVKSKILNDQIKKVVGIEKIDSSTKTK